MDFSYLIMNQDFGGHWRIPNSSLYISCYEIVSNWNVCCIDSKTPLWEYIKRDQNNLMLPCFLVHSPANIQSETWRLGHRVSFTIFVTKLIILASLLKRVFTFNNFFCPLFFSFGRQYARIQRHIFQALLRRLNTLETIYYC